MTVSAADGAARILRLHQGDKLLWIKTISVAHVMKGYRFSHVRQRRHFARTIRCLADLQGMRRFWAEKPSDGADCAGHAHGQVQQFLAAHPCLDLTRALYDTAPDIPTGNTMLVAVSWTQMTNLDDAIALKRLVDQPGTGDITELTRDDIGFTGRHYNSVIHGNTVIIAEAEPYNGAPTDEDLHKAVTDALEAPRP